MIEKAFGRLFNGYEKIDGGWDMFAIYLLTGYPVDVYQNGKDDTKTVLRELKRALKPGQAAVSLTGTVGTLDDSYHAYSVLDIDGKNMRIYNPHKTVVEDGSEYLLGGTQAKEKGNKLAGNIDLPKKIWTDSKLVKYYYVCDYKEYDAKTFHFANYGNHIINIKCKPAGERRVRVGFFRSFQDGGLKVDCGRIGMAVKQGGEEAYTIINTSVLARKNFYSKRAMGFCYVDIKKDQNEISLLPLIV